jgi:uncharacterized protein (TIGR03089 family)
VPTPADVLATLLRSDPARPRITFYDDSVNVGERIELSAKVLANWVSKAANLLQDELEVGPRSVVRLDLPAQHWRTLYWALAVWSVGATLDVQGGQAAQLLVTTDPDAASSADTDAAVLVTLAALARQHPDPMPDGVIDEARDLSTFADHFDPLVEPAADDDALVDGYGTHSYADVVPDLRWDKGSRVHVTGSPATTLRRALAAWAVDGSVVLVLGPESAGMAARLESEGVTLDLPESWL